MDLKIYSSRDFPAYLPNLSLLYDDLFTGGKGFRSHLVSLVSKPLGLDGKNLQLLAQTIEFIHNASLLHDDLVDRSVLRRGKPAAWSKYTPEYAVLAGDYLLARVMVNLSLFGNIQLVQYTAEMISDLLEGEWLQDSVVGDYFVTLDQLDRIHHLKTGSLFKWCLRAPFMAQETIFKKSLDAETKLFLEQTLDELGRILGLLFQRSDDLLDYNVRNDEGKAILGDLKSGYLNSFGAFLCHSGSQSLNRQQIDQLVKSQTLEEFQKHLGGFEVFRSKLDEFDRLNQKQLDLYEHHLQGLQQVLPDSEKHLVESLRPLSKILYWRNKNAGKTQ